MNLIHYHCLDGRRMMILLALCSIFSRILKIFLKQNYCMYPKLSSWAAHILQKKKKKKTTLHGNIRLSADRASIILIMGNLL